MAPPRPLRLAALGRVKPGYAEVLANPRARSAVMRVAERTDVPLEVRRGRFKPGPGERGAGAEGGGGAA
jgi:16S rRNA (cytosine1402-N4)-methyltransferase